jgi:hypothetical protein
MRYRPFDIERPVCGLTLSSGTGSLGREVRREALEETEGRMYGKMLSDLKSDEQW